MILKICQRFNFSLDLKSKLGDNNTMEIINPTPMLKYKTQTSYTIEDCDFNDYVYKRYGIKFNFCEDIEAVNDTCYKFNVKKICRTGHDIVRWEKFLGNVHSSCITRLILNDLCHYDLIPEGVYYINVSY